MCPSYNPDADGDFESNPMPAGEYHAKLAHVEQWVGEGDHAGKFATILKFENKEGQTATEWVRWDARGEPTQLTKKDKRPWIMNRALAALSIPNDEYWLTPLAERREKKMSINFTVQDFEARKGAIVIIGIEYNGDNNEFQNVSKLLAYSRHPEIVPSGPATVIPMGGGGVASNPDVPF